MSWLSNFVRPKLRALIKKSDSPNNLWIKCNDCGQMVYHKDLTESMNVCPNCDHHMKMTARQRIEWILDEGTIKDLNIPKINIDPLKFRDSKRYFCFKTTGLPKRIRLSTYILFIKSRQHHPRI